VGWHWIVGERDDYYLLSWAKAEKDSEKSRNTTRSEGDDLEESATRALICHEGGEQTRWER